MRTRDEVVAAVKRNSDDSWPTAPAGVYQTGVGTEGTTLRPMSGDPIWLAVLRSWLLETSTHVDADPERHRRAPVLAAAHDAWRLGVVRCLEHSGAGSSIAMETLTAYLWLAGVELAHLDAIPWGAYGAPRFDAIADGLGWSQFGILTRPAAFKFHRQAHGLRCVDECKRCPSSP